MRLTLKKFQCAPGSDGDAFSVELWHKGKKVCLVTQAGTGGPHRWHWIDQNVEKTFDSHIQSLIDRGAFEFDFEQADAYLDEMIEFRLKRHKSLIFRLRNSLFQYQAVNQKDGPETRLWLEQQFGLNVFEIVNDRYEE